MNTKSLKWLIAAGLLFIVSCTDNGTLQAGGEDVSLKDSPYEDPIETDASWDPASNMESSDVTLGSEVSAEETGGQVNQGGTFACNIATMSMCFETANAVTGQLQCAVFQGSVVNRCPPQSVQSCTEEDGTVYVYSEELIGEYCD